MLNETISPGLRVEMRKTSRFFQAVLKDAEGCWRRYSTKTADREQAIRFAQRKQAEWSVLEEHGVSASAKRFDFVAREYLKELDIAKEAGTATASHSIYVRVTRKWLIPFFGSHPLPRIDDGLIAQFEDWRRNQMG
jgi:hypothetical protein